MVSVAVPVAAIPGPTGTGMARPTRRRVTDVAEAVVHDRVIVSPALGTTAPAEKLVIVGATFTSVVATVSSAVSR